MGISFKKINLQECIQMTRTIKISSIPNQPSLVADTISKKEGFNIVVIQLPHTITQAVYSEIAEKLSVLSAGELNLNAKDMPVSILSLGDEPLDAESMEEVTIIIKETMQDKKVNEIANICVLGQGVEEIETLDTLADIFETNLIFYDYLADVEEAQKTGDSQIYSKYTIDKESEQIVLSKLEK